MFEVCQRERGLHDVTDPAWACGDVSQAAPAAGEDGEPALTQASQSAQQGVVGAVVHVENLTVSGLLDRGVHPDSRAAVATVGQRRQVQLGRGPVQRAQYVLACSRQVVYRPGLDIRDP